jgi:hypothetical protein
MSDAKLSDAISGAYFGGLLGDIIGQGSNGGNAKMMTDYNPSFTAPTEPSFRFAMINSIIRMLLDESIDKEKYATYLAGEFKNIGATKEGDTRYEFPSMMKMILSHENILRIHLLQPKRSGTRRTRIIFRI